MSEGSSSSFSVAAPRRRLLVTGGSGCLGQAVFRMWNRSSTRQPIAPIPDFEEVFFAGSKDGDLCDPSQTEALFDKVRPTDVLHLAADVGGLYKNMNDVDLTVFLNNAKMNTNVLESCLRHNVQRAIFVASTCIFPDPPPRKPMIESDMHNGLPHPSSMAYSYSKRMLSVMVSLVPKELDYTVVAPCNLYGPADNFSLDKGHVVGCLVHLGDIAGQKGTSLPVKGSGRARRQFLFVDDAAALLFWFLDHRSPERVVTLAPDGESHPISEIAKLISEASGCSGEPQFDPSFFDGQISRDASNGRMRQILAESGHEFRFTELQEGIRHTVEWFRAHRRE